MGLLLPFPRRAAPTEPPATNGWDVPRVPWPRPTIVRPRWRWQVRPRWPTLSLPRVRLPRIVLPFDADDLYKLVALVVVTGLVLWVAFFAGLAVRVFLLEAGLR